MRISFGVYICSIAPNPFEPLSVYVVSQQQSPQACKALFSNSHKPITALSAFCSFLEGLPRRYIYYGDVRVLRHPQPSSSSFFLTSGVVVPVSLFTVEH